MGCGISLLSCPTGLARTLGLGVLEEVLLLVGLFNLSKEYQHGIRERLERLLACSDMALVLRISARNGGGEGLRIDRLGLSHKQTVQSSESSGDWATWFGIGSVGCDLIGEFNERVMLRILTRAPRCMTRQSTLGG